MRQDIPTTAALHATSAHWAQWQAASWAVEGFLSTARAETPRVSVPGNGRKDDSCLQLAFPFELSKP